MLYVLVTLSRSWSAFLSYKSRRRSQMIVLLKTLVIHFVQYTLVRSCQAVQMTSSLTTCLLFKYAIKFFKPVSFSNQSNILLFSLLLPLVSRLKLQQFSRMQTSSDITEHHFLNTLKCTRGLSNNKKRFFSTVHTYKRQCFSRLSRQLYDLKLKTESTQIPQVALNVINNTRSSSTTPISFSVNSQVCTESQEFHLTRSANIIILFTVCLSRRVSLFGVLPSKNNMRENASLCVRMLVQYFKVSVKSKWLHVLFCTNLKSFELISRAFRRARIFLRLGFHLAA